MKPSLHRLLRVVALGMGISLMTATTASANTGRDDSFHRSLTFATYNIDLGADLSPVFGATGLSLIQKAATAWAEVQASNFPERAQSLARLLAKRSPDVIGLQEVALWQTGSFNPANPLDPNVVFTTNYDFLVLLRDALAARGFKYAVADDNITFVGQAPVSLSQQVRYTDRNVILVRAGHHGVDYTTPAPGGHVYAARIPTSVGGV